MTIGILGGGQLGYMLALAGYPLGLHFRFLDPSPEAPVGRIAQRVTADYTDQAALEKFSSGLELSKTSLSKPPVFLLSAFLSIRRPRLLKQRRIASPKRISSANSASPPQNSPPFRIPPNSMPLLRESVSPPF